MMILAKITTISIILLLLTYIVVFYTPIAKKFIPQLNNPPPALTQTTPTPTPNIQPTADKCIITIDGVSYDVTQYKKDHTGGDVFKCGTDMTALLNKRHPDPKYLKQMAPYKI